MIEANGIQAAASSGRRIEKDKRTMEIQTVYFILVGLVGALSGVLVGGGGVAVILARANQSKELKDSTEKLLAELVPADVVKQMNALFKTALDKLPSATSTIQNAAEFVVGVTDGQVNG